MTDLRLDAPEPLLTIQRRTGLADEIRRETAPLLADEAISECPSGNDLIPLPEALTIRFGLLGRSTALGARQ